MPAEAFRPLEAWEPDPAPDAEGSGQDQWTVGELIDRRIGHGRCHRLIFVVGLCVYGCAGMAGGVAPFLMGPVSAQLSLSRWQQGALASAMFAGMAAGSPVGGLCTDWLGPARTMLLSMLLLLLAPCLLLLSQGFALFIGSRLLVGAALVTAYLASNTWVAELVPTEQRSVYLSLMHAGVQLGIILTTTIAALLPPEEWRLLLLINTLPTLVCLLATCRFLFRYESPRWLLVTGRTARCREVLELLQALNSDQPARPLPQRLCLQPSSAPHPTATQPPVTKELDVLGVEVQESETASLAAAPSDSADSAAEERWAQLWRVGVCSQLLLGGLVAFLLNFGAKGTELWAAVYTERKLGPAAHQVAVSMYYVRALGKISGDAINFKFVACAGRLRTLCACFWGCAVSLVVYASTDLPGVMLFSMGLEALFEDMLWCNLYILLAELQPTSVRSSAFGLSMGIGRIGGVVSTAVGDALMDFSLPAIFFTYAASFACGGFAVLLIRNETSKQVLADQT